MMRSIGIALLVSLAAAPVAAPVAAQGSRVRIAVAGHSAPVLVDSLASEFTIVAPRAATLDATTRALTQLGATLDLIDPRRGMVGMTNAPRMRTFGGSRLSRWVNCGNGMMGSNADSWRVFLTVYAFVDAIDSTSTRLRVAVVAGARDVAGTSTEPVRCASTGSLEEATAERVRRLLATGSP
jgi:hypothetical protein